MAEKITGPGWEIPENAKKVELHYPASWAEKLHLNLADHPEALEQHVKRWIIEDIQKYNPGVNISYIINPDHSFVVTISEQELGKINDSCWSVFENAFEDGAQIVAY